MRGSRPRLRWVQPLLAVVLGALTAWLGTAVHLARQPVGEVLVPLGLLLALGLVVSTDLAVAALTGSPAVVFGLSAGRATALGLVLFPTAGGDIVVTGALTSTVWVLLAVLLPAFLGPVLGVRVAVRNASAGRSVSL